MSRDGLKLLVLKNRPMNKVAESLGVLFYLENMYLREN